MQIRSDFFAQSC